MEEGIVTDVEIEETKEEACDERRSNSTSLAVPRTYQSALTPHMGQLERSQACASSSGNHKRNNNFFGLFKASGQSHGVAPTPSKWPTQEMRAVHMVLKIVLGKNLLKMIGAAFSAWKIKAFIQAQREAQDKENSVHFDKLRTLANELSSIARTARDLEQEVERLRLENKELRENRFEGVKSILTSAISSNNPNTDNLCETDVEDPDEDDSSIHEDTDADDDDRGNDGEDCDFDSPFVLSRYEDFKHVYHKFAGNGRMGQQEWLELALSVGICPDLVPRRCVIQVFRSRSNLHQGRLVIALRDFILCFMSLAELYNPSMTVEDGIKVFLFKLRESEKHFPKIGLDARSVLRIPLEGADEEELLKQVFRYYATFGNRGTSGHKISAPKFSKMCRECGLLSLEGSRLRPQDFDLCFTTILKDSHRHHGGSGRKSLDFEQAQKAMALLGRKHMATDRAQEAYESIRKAIVSTYLLRQL